MSSSERISIYFGIFISNLLLLGGACKAGVRISYENYRQYVISRAEVDFLSNLFTIFIILKFEVDLCFRAN